MKVLKLALAAGAATLALTGAAHAEVAFNAGVTSEYLFRGLSQGSYAAGFGGIDWSGESGVYAGAWTSSVGFGPSAEVDLYGGWKGKAGDADVDLGVIYYGYVNDVNTYTNYKTGLVDSKIGAAYTEVYAKGSFPVGMGAMTGAVYYSPDFFAEGGNATYYEVGFSAPYKDVSFSGAFGIQDIDKPMAGLTSCAGAKCEDSYTTWNIGFTVPITMSANVDVRYTGTSDDAYHFANPNLAGTAVNGVTAKLTATFK